jgi:hypothetical protein
MCTELSKFLNFIAHILCFSTLLAHIILLFLKETITTLSDGVSYSLFDLGLDLNNF